MDFPNFLDSPGNSDFFLESKGFSSTFTSAPSHVLIALPVWLFSGYG